MSITVPVMRQHDTHRSFVWTPSMATCRYSLQTHYQCVIKEQLPTVHPEVDISHEISIPACYKHSRAPRARGCTYHEPNLPASVLQTNNRVLVPDLSERGGPGKLWSHWEQQIHNGPIYEVTPEAEKQCKRVLHRHLLFSCKLLLPDPLHKRKQQGLTLDDILREASQPKTPSVAEQPLLDPPSATSVEPQVQATPDAASPTLSPATSLKTTSNSSEDQQAESPEDSLAAPRHVPLRSGRTYSSGTCYGSDSMVAQAASLEANVITSGSPYFQHLLQWFPFTTAVVTHPPFLPPWLPKFSQPWWISSATPWFVYYSSPYPYFNHNQYCVCTD